MFEDAIFVCISVTVFLIGTTKVKVRRTLFKWVLQMFFQSIFRFNWGQGVQVHKSDKSKTWFDLSQRSGWTT